jgi:hypothetical protein
LFTNFTSGEYNEYTLSVKTDEYQADVRATVEPNMTKTQNISLDLVHVTVTGIALYKGEGIEEVDIEFGSNGSVGRNTAEDASTATDDDGSYSINLQPGSYNISVSKYDGDTPVYLLEGETIELERGQGFDTKDFNLERKSVTVDGTTTAEGILVENVTLNFLENKSKSIKNNTAIETSIKSNQNGLFTIELAPGFYNVTGESEERTDADGNFSYYGQKSIEVKEEEIGDIKTFNFDTLERMDI